MYCVSGHIQSKLCQFQAEKNSLWQFVQIDCLEDNVLTLGRNHARTLEYTSTHSTLSSMLHKYTLRTGWTMHLYRYSIYYHLHFTLKNSKVSCTVFVAVLKSYSVIVSSFVFYFVDLTRSLFAFTTFCEVVISDFLHVFTLRVQHLFCLISHQETEERERQTERLEERKRERGVEVRRKGTQQEKRKVTENVTEEKSVNQVIIKVM